ncbi:LAMI_0F04962g1_1 [Lachancea mirantina]|uniref:LAMI_0F04962g1_1 n=1 Tax=Lachancea mirantina TaxID=1230905 RepID=A0A1G4JYC1_9SACH|nr:LAMI_0F04962g1_1 [Lachancea mirantina]
MSLLRTVRNIGQSQTEIKVKKATDDDELNGATGTLMSELSVLTYSPRTLREIIQVIRKRLSGNYQKSSHKNAVHILKTLTLVAHLINNGSNEFVSWIRAYSYLVTTLKEFDVSDKRDGQVALQIRTIASRLTELLKDDELLRRARNDLTQFRSSISTPGRKSTDNSHLKVQGSAAVGHVRPSRLRETQSLDINRPTQFVPDQHVRGYVLGPLEEEESIDKENDENSGYRPCEKDGLSRRRGVPRLLSNNPFV